MTFFHNSQDIHYRKPLGAVTCGMKITIRAKAEGMSAVTLRLWYDSVEHLVPMQLEGGHYEATITMPEEPRLVWYYFIAETAEGRRFYGNNEKCLGGEGAIYDYEPNSFQITVYRKEYTTPDWFKDSVMYHIFVDRFAKHGQVVPTRDDYVVHKNWNEPICFNCDERGHLLCNDFYGGNLQGIMDKLDYLVDLGVSVIYLSPIFEAWSNHKYDTANYKNVDPMFGSEETLRELCKKAEEKGIAIILDGVFNHTGSDSLYFNKKGTYGTIGAYQSKKSEYYDWYSFGDEYNCGYNAWWGVHSLPSVNEMNEGYRNYIINDPDSVVKHWTQCGIKGWRLDVADELPPQFIRELRTAVKETNKDTVIIGEVWEDASNKISYGEQREYLLGNELDSVMNYPFKDAMLGYILGGMRAEEFNAVIMSICENYPHPALYSVMNILGSHDVERISTLFGEAPKNLSIQEKMHYSLPNDKKELANKRVKLAVMWQMTFMGVPCVYYGDEVGVQGHRDPFNRAPFPWNSVDYELMEWYKMMIKMRNASVAMRTGKYIPLVCEGDIYAYMRVTDKGKDAMGRECDDETVVVILNRGEQERTVVIDLSEHGITKIVDVVNGDKEISKDGVFNFNIEPMSGKILLDKKPVALKKELVKTEAKKECLCEV